MFQKFTDLLYMQWPNFYHCLVSSTQFVVQELTFVFTFRDLGRHLLCYYILSVVGFHSGYSHNALYAFIANLGMSRSCVVADASLHDKWILSCALHDLWFMISEIWITNYCLMPYGLWVMPYGLCIMTPGIWVMYYGLCIMYSEFLIVNYALWLIDHELWILGRALRFWLPFFID